MSSLDFDLFCGFCASAVFGSVTVKTPFLRLASILSVSTPSEGEAALEEPNSRSLT